MTPRTNYMQRFLTPQENEIQNEGPREPGSAGHVNPLGGTDWNKLAGSTPPSTDYRVKESMGQSSRSNKVGFPLPKRFGIENVESVLSSYSEVDSSWTEGNFTHLLLGSESTNLGFNGWSDCGSTIQTPRGEFAAPSWPKYNLFSPEKLGADVIQNTHNSYPLAPVTPDDVNQIKCLENTEFLDFSSYDNSSQDKDNTETLLTSVVTDAADGGCKDLQNIDALSSGVINPPLNENNTTEKEDDRGIDLNKTPQQKRPKRRKHRPKVIMEGKQKKTPRTKTPKDSNLEKSSQKRKYVRKKKLEPGTSQQLEAAADITVPSVKTTPRSCRRRLNFDLQDNRKKENQGQESIHGAHLGMENLKSGYLERNQETESKSSDIGPAENINPLEKPLSISPPPSSKENTINVIARSLNLRKTSLFQKERGGTNQERHSPGIPIRNIFQSHTTQLSLQNLRPLAWESTAQTAESKDYPNGERGKKRSYLDSTEQAGSFSGTRNGGSLNTWSSKSNDRKMIRNEFYMDEYKTSHTSVDKDSQEQVATVGRSNNAVQGDVRKLNSKKFKGEGHSNPIISKQHINNQFCESELPKSRRMTKPRPNRSMQDHKTNSTALMVKSKQLSPKEQREPPTIGYTDRSEASPSTMLLMKSSKATTSSDMARPSTGDTSLPENPSQHHQQLSIKARGQQNQHHQADMIDQITSLLQLLSFSDGSKESDEDDKVALVPYEGDGTMVLHEGHDPTKKSRLRPKVELDPETDRMWKLIMGKEVNGNTEAQDIDKEILWEEERKVFRGRVDSFTARMHLIQGDRRFSRWKGSVLDSVIGVFLTQNVSDHLSSSAFMSLAARFPLQPDNILEQNYQVEISSQVKETEILLPDLNSPANCFEDIIWEQVYEQVIESNGIEDKKDSTAQNSSYASVHHVTRDIPSCSGSNSKATCWGSTTSIDNHSTLSQGQRGVPLKLYHNPLTGSLCFGDRYDDFHNRSEDMGCYQKMPDLDKSNDLRNSYRVHPSNPHIQIPEVFPNYLPLQVRTDLAAQDIFGLFSDKNIPSSHKEKDADYMNQSVADTAERISKASLQKVGQPMIQATQIYPYTFGTHLLTQPKDSLPSLSHFDYNLRPDQQRLGTVHAETSSGEGPRKPAETDFTSEGCMAYQSAGDPKTNANASGVVDRSNVAGKDTDLLTKSVEVHREEKETLCGKTTDTNTDFQSTRKGKTKVEKNNSFDWDSLRKMVQPDGRRKERSKDTMDSVDYEAIRNADVNEISNAIKERGMNNMLAERIKDFLNRLVREHGSMDLEWLRDVPPEKAKDYLLSIQGLGLKSAECVRLLTLHHLAFPVDTNVARIAVRLGWVPLQPLPESLQLHLLELYPMMESIQKYLWPRLCKLDQRTLYELHYQMITFGKVFCTKNKPNCNSCPMRAECRHFASAFASARQALPGPEEKGITSFPVPIPADKGTAPAISPRPLLPAGREELPGTETGLCNYEPIVEEPATPDPDTEEVTESDIEDAFYEDPDEIPTIKLNVQEFTRTLHDYIQENNELHDIDMSKALVALNPEAAFIPTQKLKNVNRLRTEHQVYELPDSHHLLRGRDKREPDDPSPYLLAIWTPGETANSVQPPAECCKFQESGKLCDEKACFSCNSVREANSQTVRGTLLVPCRTATRGSFPLNGTYFQVNEVFADHESSINPIEVPRAWIWNLPRRTVYFGTSVSTIFRGLSKEEIQYCFWRGFICVRGFDQMSRAPRPLMARLHFPASKQSKTKVKTNEKADVTRKQ